MGDQYVLAIDQGTTGTRVMLFDHSGRAAGRAYREFRQIYPRPGWVEHDPEEIWESVVEALNELLARTGIDPSAIVALGITNQRETAILWDRSTGKPVYNAIVWQCRRTAPICEDLKKAGLEDEFRTRTGLVLDAYFSGTKIRWILDNVPGARSAAGRGELAFGTVDTWLVWKLTGGRVHATDVTNASRTLLFDISKMKWDQELAGILDVPVQILPEVRSSSEVYGKVVADTATGLLSGIPIAGIAGDQQAALFGQACFEPGMVKNTYGTGCFILMNTGTQPVMSRKGLLTTVAWSTGQKIQYALEGSVFIAGAVVQWLRDELKLIRTAAESEECANNVPDTAGVYLVPAFVGLGAPHWDMYARGIITGLTRGAGRDHIVRSALESIAYQSKDVIDVMVQESGANVPVLRVDGGASANNFLMKFQADILGIRVERPGVAETTALGAAYLAGLATGFWESTRDIAQNWQLESAFEPSMADGERSRLYSGWKRAVERARGWAQD